MVGSAENKASSVPIELGLGLSLAKAVHYRRASQLPEQQPSGTPTARAKTLFWPAFPDTLYNLVLKVTIPTCCFLVPPPDGL